MGVAAALLADSPSNVSVLSGEVAHFLSLVVVCTCITFLGFVLLTLVLILMTPDREAAVSAAMLRAEKSV